jgi:hypothetical protein
VIRSGRLLLSKKILVSYSVDSPINGENVYLISAKHILCTEKINIIIIFENIISVVLNFDSTITPPFCLKKIILLLAFGVNYIKYNNFFKNKSIIDLGNYL